MTSPMERPPPGYAPATPNDTTPRAPPSVSRSAVAVAAAVFPTPHTRVSAPWATAASVSVAAATGAAGEITAVIPDHAYFDDPVQVGDAVTLAWKPEDAHRLAA